MQHKTNPPTSLVQETPKPRAYYAPPQLVKLESVPPESGATSKVNENTGGMFS